MNKRQWKKRYKKEHGNNPPSEKQVKRWMEELPQKNKYIVTTVKEIVNKICTTRVMGTEKRQQGRE